MPIPYPNTIQREVKCVKLSIKLNQKAIQLLDLNDV